MISRRPRTLRHRMSVLALAVIAGWLVLLAAGFDLVLSSRVDKQIEDELRVRAQAASATVHVRDGAVVGVRESATDSELDSSIWVYRATTAVSRPHLHGGADVQRAADALARSGARTAEVGERKLYSLPVQSGGRRVGAVVAAIDTEPYDDTRHTAILGSVVVAVLLLGGAYPVLRHVTGRALRPVADMTRQAAEWSVSAPTQRFGEHLRYAELSSLAGTLDELLDRLAAVLRHEKQLSAELSHELRTPLTRVLAEVDLLLGDSPARYRPALVAIRENCLAMDGLIDTLLAAARAELVRTVGRADLDTILKSFTTAQGDPAVVADPTDLSVGVDADVVTRALSPIVDNARRHARTAVRLRATRAPGGVVTAVSNDGPVLSAELAERVFEPGFTRDDTGRHAGAGLGLALSRRLARAADGDVVVATDAAQTTFLLTLPPG